MLKAAEDAEGNLAKRRDASWQALGIDIAKMRRLSALADEMVKDPAAAVGLLDARLAFLDGEGLFDPTAFCSRIHTQARLLALPAASPEDRGRRVEQLMGLARDAVAATAKVPLEREFDSDRIALLGAAGQLIHTAVTYSHTGPKYDGPRRWSEFHDPRADEGIRVLDEALDLAGDFGDRDGQLRATRAWLLFQRGLPEAALVQGQKVESLRLADPVTQYNLAKVYAHTGNRKEAVKRFEAAVKAGYRDLAGTFADADVPKSQPYWAESTVKPKLTVIRYATAGGGDTHTLEIRNTGELPLVNAKLFFSSDKSNAKAPLAHVKVPYLAPGDTYYWVNACKMTGFEFPPPGLVVELPHLVVPGTGKPRPLPYEVKSGDYTPYRWRY